MRSRISLVRLGILAVMMGLLAVPADTQTRDRDARQRHRSSIQHLPKDKTVFRHGGHRYYFHHGHYYRRYPHGYVVVRAPLGWRMRALPAGSITIHFGRVPYFFSFGTFYRIDPMTHEYIVVRQPAREMVVSTSSGPDRIVLTDGNSLYGVFLKGDGDIIQFEVNGTVRDIPIQKIRSIECASASVDNED